MPAGFESLLDVFVEGDELFDAMLRDIHRAERSIRLESYILASDGGGRPFIEAVSHCARRGIEVSLRADHAGSWFELSRADIDALRMAGARFEWSRPWSPQKPLAFNRRNHRKLLVVDKAIAYVGGFNLHAASSRRVSGDGRRRRRGRRRPS